MILRHPAIHPSTGLVVISVCLLLPGCAHNTYSVSSLPRKYDARPVANYSSLNLTAYARSEPSGYEIRYGDRLEVALHSGLSGQEAVEEWTVGVDDDGHAILPNIGRVRLAGLTRAQAEQTIINESIVRDVYLTPAVGLKVQERRQNSIIVAGGIGIPGRLEFPESSLTLAEVIVRSGGLTETATGEITVNHAESSWDGGDQLTTVTQTTDTGDSLSVSLATTTAAELARIHIPAGATVAFQENPSRSIRVIGVIRDRAVDIPPGRNLRLLDALAMAGGPTYSHWISNRVDIIRRVPGRNETIRIKASIRRAKKDAKANLRLTANDIVSVEENVATFTLSTLGGLGGLMTAARLATLH